jgi:hypothetical protein
MKREGEDHEFIYVTEPLSSQAPEIQASEKDGRAYDFHFVLRIAEFARQK